MTQGTAGQVVRGASQEAHAGEGKSPGVEGGRGRRVPAALRWQGILGNSHMDHRVLVGHQHPAAPIPRLNVPCPVPLLLIHCCIATHTTL